MKKKIIEINEELCIGCGNCVTSCAQGALQIINGKAKLVKEDFCDGLGKCIGHCPTDALQIIEKDVQVKTLTKCSCPSSAPIKNNNVKQWPLQLHLVNPSADYFKNTELLVISTCAPLASPKLHLMLGSNKSMVLACPKLDNTEGYVEKLRDIFIEGNTPKVTVFVMEVPCCNGLLSLVRTAIELSGRNNIELKTILVGLDGDFVI